MIFAERAIEFEKVKNKWSELALTKAAKERIEKTQVFLDQGRLLAELRSTTEARILLEKGGNPPLVSLTGIRELVDVSAKGDCLSPLQLEEIEKSLVAVRRLKDYLSRGKQYEISLPYYEENLDDLSHIGKEINLQIRGGRVADYATKLLGDIRSQIERTEAKQKEKAEAILRGNKQYMSDSFVTSRSGRLCVPVKREYRSRIEGKIVDKSATGSTLFIEPGSVAKYGEEIQLLRVDEENEERRILYTLTAMISENHREILQNIRTMEKLDFIFSKGKLSIELQGAEPAINTERFLILKDARHPLMEEEACVPLQFEIGRENRGIVITGPNTGGKTVALKTVALNCMMAQCGLHVTCKEAKICMNSSFLCDIGDGQDLSENLSTFSAHIRNVMDILEKVTEESMVIMDELGSGTDPTEGMGIAIAILEELRKSGCLFLVTTHYPEVKQYAEDREGIVNARMTFDRESLRPLFHMIIGEAGESCAFYIAEKLGMPEIMLENARRAADGKPLLLEQKKKEKNKGSRIRQKKESSMAEPLSEKFRLGDSVVVYPDKKTGIVCQTVNEKGVLRVQMPEKKIWINHKRVRLLVPASQLYPEDYDFSIIFETVENRKLRHDMERKYVEGQIVCEKEK